MRLLDLTCNDGWMLANLHTSDEKFTELCGMELNADASERARKRQAEYGWAGTIVTDNLFNAPEHFEPHSFDAVIAFETIEHVPEPRALVELACRMCKPGGRVYISTPDGAYERGNIPDWFRVESKGHLWALRPQDLAGLLCEQGIVRDFEIEGRVQVGSVEPRERAGRIDFVGGPVDALPELVMAEGLGGSETAMVKMAEHFARKGYDVRVFAGEGPGGLRGDHVSVGEQRHENGQVLYAPWSAWDPAAPADICVVSRRPDCFDRTITAPRRVLWLHDADYADALTEERASRATDIAVLSEFQRDLLCDRYPFLENHDGLWVTRNGIETSFYADELPEKEPIAVYSSSPDRGLEVLLELWPEVRKQVPDAELHFGYAPVYRAFSQVQDRLKALDERLAKLTDQKGLVNFGSLGQKALADLFRRARVWSYPSFQSPEGVWFPEISCLSAMEAQAAGCVAVCARYGALKETVRDEHLTIPTDEGMTADWKAAFVEAVVAGLTEVEADPSVREWTLVNRDWSGVADAWEKRLTETPSLALAA